VWRWTPDPVCIRVPEGGIAAAVTAEGREHAHARKCHERDHREAWVSEHWTATGPRRITSCDHKSPTRPVDLIAGEGHDEHMATPTHDHGCNPHEGGDSTFRSSLTGTHARMHQALTDLCAYLLVLDAERHRLAQVVDTASSDADAEMRSDIQGNLAAIGAASEVLGGMLTALRACAGLPGVSGNLRAE
jgi:hypothetical protein